VVKKKTLEKIDLILAGRKDPTLGGNKDPTPEENQRAPLEIPHSNAEERSAIN